MVPPPVWMYFTVGAGFVVALNLPLVVVARAIARTAMSRAERARDELGPERRARLERHVRA
jgi:hypothetical protein